MSGHISVLVKPMGKAGKAMALSGTPIWKRSKKKKELDTVVVRFNDKTEILGASDTPYVFPVEPGHYVVSAEPVDRSLSVGKALSGGMMGAAFKAGMAMMSGGSALNELAKGIGNSKANHERAVQKESIREFDLADGKTVCIQCQPPGKGLVKVSVI